MIARISSCVHRNNWIVDLSCSFLLGCMVILLVPGSKFQVGFQTCKLTHLAIFRMSYWIVYSATPNHSCNPPALLCRVAVHGCSPLLKLPKFGAASHILKMANTARHSQNHEPLHQYAPIIYMGLSENRVYSQL